MAQARKSRNFLGFGKRKPARRKSKAKAAPRRKMFGWLTEKKETYRRDVKGERADAMADRRERLELKKLRAQEIAADASIAAAERRIESAEKKIGKAEKQAAGGNITESRLDEIKAHMEREIAAQEKHKAAVLANNPGCARTPAMEFSTEYHLGYNLGQTDRQSAQLRKTIPELHATFVANFGASPSAQWESFEQAYQAGYGGGTARPQAGNPHTRVNGGSPKAEKLQAERRILYAKIQGRDQSAPDVKPIVKRIHAISRQIDKLSFKMAQNPVEGDGSAEYEQAKRTAELFHGRPVQDEITVDESIRTHDWYVSIGPLISLKVRTLLKKNVTLPFARPLGRTSGNVVHLFCSPDGRQFYLRGGDQELDVKALGMGPGTDWYRDLMVIGECKEITYQDKKKFHKFKLTDYYHKLGENTRVKPALTFNALANKMEIIGGQYKVEMEDLVDGMSPGIVN